MATQSNKATAHAWAHQTHDQGKNGNGSIFFVDDTIYSYGYHFPMAKHMDNGSILMTTGSYSATTSVHMSDVMQALPHDNVFSVLNVEAVLKTSHKKNYADYKRRIEEKLKKAVMSRKYGEILQGQAVYLAEQANAYSKLFKLGYRAIDISGYDLEAIKKAAKAANKVKREAEKEMEAARLLLKMQDIIDWKAGLTNHKPYGLKKVYLRVNGDNVETSQHASFPIDHAPLAWAMISRCVKNKTNWSANGHTIKLGHFQVNSISAKGVLVAGCHRVEYDEMLEVAVELGLTKGES